MPLAEADLTITSILEELQKDPNPVKSDKRPLRATGVALQVAVGLLESSFQNSGILITFVLILTFYFKEEELCYLPEDLSPKDRDKSPPKT